MYKVAIFALLVVGLASTAQALNCYNCYAWEGVPGSSEPCRTTGTVGSATCTDTNTLLYDPVSNTLRNLTTADRAVGDHLCLKLTGTDTANKNVIFRGCGKALVGGDLNGKCEKSTADENLGIGIIKAGAVTWISTANNGNGGAVSATCNDGGGGGNGAGQMAASLGLLVSAMAGIRMLKA